MPEELVPVKLLFGPSYSHWWNESGQCFEQTDDGPVTRRDDLDFGTPMGDLLVDPWIQTALKDKSDA